MNKLAGIAAVLTLVAAGSAAALADDATAAANKATGVEPHGRPVDMTNAPADPAAPNQDLLALWANKGTITKAKADSVRAQIEKEGKMPGTLAYDQEAGILAFGNDGSPENQGN